LRWDTFLDAAKRLAGDGPDEQGWLRQLDVVLSQMSEPAPPVSEWWHWSLGEFWRSGRTYGAWEKGQRSTASTTFARTLIAETFLRERNLVLNQVGICSLVAVTKRETMTAIGSTVTSACEALGLSKAGRGQDPTATTYVAHTMDWTTLDAAGRKISFQVRPPNLDASAAGTFVGYLADEVNLWDKEQSLNAPADKVLEILGGRFAHQPGAHGYHTSTPEGRDGALSTMIRESLKLGSESIFIGRLGELGARRDEIARRGLREYFARRAREAPEQATRTSRARWAADERLIRDPDPRSTNIPTWSARGGDPVEEIMECWRLVDVALRDGKEGGDPLDVLLHRYGAQPGGDAGRRIFGEQIIADARARAVTW
jgi:hypothetical protein